MPKSAPQSTVCRMCGREDARQLGAVDPTHPARFHVDTFYLQYCARCDVVYLDPLPTEGDLHALYEDSDQFTDPHYTDPEQVEKYLDYYGTALRNLALLPEGRGRVLEVGAGLAWVSRAAKALSTDVETVAQDVSAECADHCPWVDSYFVGTVEALPDGDPFQLASMTHVIEHLVDPEKMVGRIAEHLAPGGRLFVTAPYRPTGWRPEQGLAPWRDYSYLHVPAHVSYLSRNWFEQIAPKHRMSVAHWDARHEDGQAFELVLAKDE
jgi:SAM-dependent methyltransferase